MVLPPPAADDPQDPEEPGWAERVARLIGFSERGILILVGGARDARLRELLLALLPEHPELEVYTDPRPLADAPEKATVVLAPGAEHATWLNLNRQLFARLRVVLWCDAETARVLAREAVDFFDWTSHRVECPEGPPPFVVAGIRASVVARAPGVLWGGDRAGFEAALAVAFPARKVQWLNAETSKEAMVASAGQRGPDWLGFDDAAGSEKLDVFQSVLGALHMRGRAAILGIPEEAAGWHPVRDRVAGLVRSRARLAQAGATKPGRLAALSGLEPDAVDMLVALLLVGTGVAEIEADLMGSADPGVVIARLATDRGVVGRGALLPPVLRAFAGDPEVRREHEVPARPIADADIREAIADLHGGERGLEHLYRRTIVDQFEHLTFKGIARTGRAISLPLDKVYVALKAVADVPEAADTYSADERRLLLEARQRGRLDDEVRMELDSLRFQRWQDESREAGARNVRRSIEDAVGDPAEPGVVILGDPGSGKTTLLHYLALRAARGDAPDPATVGGLGVVLRTPANQPRLPIFVPLAAYDDHVRREGSVSLRDFLAVYYDKRLSLPGLGPVFHEVLEEGRALVLLDGLDEVLDVGMRVRVANEARALIQQEAGRGNRFVITSRFVGYREAPLSGVSCISVVPFGKEDIETFARQWCEAYEVWAAEGRRTEVALKKADGEARALIADVETNPSVLALAANPMLLTMLALLRRQGGKLPEQRVKLYLQYVETLLDNNWEAVRSEGAREAPPERFDQQTATEYLIELSLWLQRHKPSGTASRHDLETALIAIDLTLEGHDPEAPPAKARIEAQRRVAFFLKDMRHLAGLLAERGRDAFGFLHLTFQEYFAGRALARMTSEERWGVIRENLHRPRWKEPILLCAGWLGIVETRRKEVSALARRILDAKSPHEEILHRDLFLASDLAADNVGLDKGVLDDLQARLVPLTESGVPKLRAGALGGLAQLARLGHEQTIAWWLKRIDGKIDPPETADALVSVLDAETCAPLRRAICGWLKTSDMVVRRWAEYKLATLVTKDEELGRRFLLDLNHDDPTVRALAVGALQLHSLSETEMVGLLIPKLDDPVGHVRWTAINILGKLISRNAEAQDHVLRKLSDEDGAVRLAAAFALKPLASSDSDVRRLLLAKLDDPHVAEMAVIPALAPLAAYDPDVRRQLFAKLEDEDEHMRSATAVALCPLSSDDPNVRHLVLRALDDPSMFVRGEVAKALAPLAIRDAEIRARLLDTLEDPTDWVQGRVVQTLGPSARIHEDVRHAITAKLGASSVWVRGEAVGALGTLVSHAEVFAPILDILDDENDYVRLKAARVLSQRADAALGRRIASAISEVLARLTITRSDQGDLRWNERSDAVNLLGQLDWIGRDDGVFSSLVRVLQSDGNLLVRNAAYEALLRLTVPPERSELSEHSWAEVGPSQAVHSDMLLRFSAALHLSDLHFGTSENASLWRTQLAEDLRDQSVTHLDALILSGDIANRSTPDEYAAARTFVEALREELHLAPDRIIVVPGNHDLNWELSEGSYVFHKRKNLARPLAEGTFIEHGTEAVELRDEDLYRRRFDHFARFYEDICGEPYPLHYADQGIVYHLAAQGILVLGLNSAWELDHHFKARASIHAEALSRALDRIRRTPALDACPLKIAVWHHPIHSPHEDRIKDAGSLQQLAKAGFRLALHGHIHKAERSDFHYDQTASGRKLDIVGAGTFGAPVREWVPGYPLQYNLLRFEGRALTVETRRREEPNGAWSPDARWLQGPGKDPLPRYTVELFQGP